MHMMRAWVTALYFIYASGAAEAGQKKKKDIVDDET